MSRMKADGSFGPGRVVRELSTEFEDIMPNVRARPDGGGVRDRVQLQPPDVG